MWICCTICQSFAIFAFLRHWRPSQIQVVCRSAKIQSIAAFQICLSQQHFHTLSNIFEQFHCQICSSIFTHCQIYLKSSRAFAHVEDQSRARAVCSRARFPPTPVCPSVQRGEGGADDVNGGRTSHLPEPPLLLPPLKHTFSADMTRMISYLSWKVRWMLIIWEAIWGRSWWSVSVTLRPTH